MEHKDRTKTAFAGRGKATLSEHFQHFAVFANDVKTGPAPVAISGRQTLSVYGIHFSDAVTVGADNVGDVLSLSLIHI